MEMKKRFAKIRRWDEGVPLGCGRIGALVYGGNPLVVSLDRIDLWDLTPCPEWRDSNYFYANMVFDVGEAKSEGELQKAISLFNGTYRHKTPTKIKAGRFLLEGYEGASFLWDYRHGECRANAGERSLSLFLSQSDFLGAIASKDPLPISFEAPKILFGEEGLGYPPMEVKTEGGLSVYLIHDKGDYSFAVLLLERESGGLHEAYFDIACPADGPDYLEKAKRKLLLAAEKGYAALKESSDAWWEEYWSKSGVSLPESSFQREYDLADYFMASTSRKGCAPMPLQGVWTADGDDLPPWKGDYHNDLNTEMSYCAYLSANHLEEGEAMLDFLYARKPTFERVAKDVYGVDGLIIPGTMDYLGRPLGGWPMYSASPTMGIFLLTLFDEYYRFTGDEQFFASRAYPMFYEQGQAILGLLREGEDGYLYLPLSSSPEMHDDTRKSFCEPISNFDLALLRYLFRTLAEYARKKGISPHEYEDVLSRLRPYFQGKDGAYWIDGRENFPASHRHFSHLFMIAPLGEVDGGSPEGEKAIRASLRRIERFGTSMWVGYSFPWEAILALKGHEPELAYRRLGEFLSAFVGRNGFHLNGDFKKKGYSTFTYRPFTLEGNFAYQRAIQEMLLLEEGGCLSLFRGIPEKWKDEKLSFRGLRVKGGCLISASYDKGKVTSLSAKAMKQMALTFLFPNGEKREYALKEGENLLLA